MKKSFKSYAVVWAIALAVFSVIAFLLHQGKFGGSFWLGYIFAVLAFIIQLGTAFFAFKESNLDKVFLKISTVNISFTTLIFQVIAGAVFMTIPNILPVIPAVGCLLIAVFGIISVLCANAGGEIVSEIDDKNKSKVDFIKMLQADVDILADSETDPEIKKMLQKLSEEIRYSDPMSSEAVEDIESEIQDKVGDIANVDNKAELINEILTLLSTRNKKVKLLK